MIKIIKRIHRLAEGLSIRLKLSYFFSFLDAVFSMFALASLFLFLSSMERQEPYTDRLLFQIIGLLILGIAGKAVSQYFVYRLQSTAGYEVVAKERMRVGDHLKRVSMGYFYEHDLGEITASVTSDLNFMEQYSMHMLDKIVTGFLATAAISFFVMAFNWKIGLIFIAGAAISMIVYHKLQLQSILASKKEQAAQKDAIAATLEYIQGISVVKSFHMHEKQLDGMEEIFTKSEEASSEPLKVFTPLYGVYAMIFRTAACLIVLAASYLVLGNKMDYAGFAVILCAAFTVFTPLETMGQLTQLIRRMDESLNRVEELKAAKEIDREGRKIELDKFTVVFENVEFSYDGQRPLIRNVSFRLPEHTITAIVGPSGSGKTTITRLLARFWDVQKGSIRIGGRDIREFTGESLLSYMSMVFQNVYLFHDTVENNIKYGNPNAAREEVIQAAKKACCHEFIMKLPNGYDTMIKEAGSNLSGGEKQRISIARAILKNAPIVLLDEATASVDPENEVEIRKAIDALVKDKTLLVIAHRISTIKNADQIIVINEGKVEQCGKHEELLEEEGIYRTYWHIRKKADNWHM